MDFTKKLGMQKGNTNPNIDEKALRKYINFKLQALGQPANLSFKAEGESEKAFLEMATWFFKDYDKKNRTLARSLCPDDNKIQNFIDDYFGDTASLLPSPTFILDRWGLAAMLSLPADSNEYENPYIKSYRIKQGVLHNPVHDRRTTKGSFHVAEGGLLIPDDKITVPKQAAAKMLWHAFNPPKQMLELPFTANQSQKAECFVSVLLKPIVAPEIASKQEEKNMHIRFFVPGSCVSALQFVESIFGNEADPFLLENNPDLDVEHYCGITGGIILAPHLIHLTKKELGLPHKSQASETEIKNNMFYQNEDELYNNGSAFKLTFRNKNGIFTIIADSYFGYCKKEVKTQISFASNLTGFSEEEHSGGALAFPRYNIGDNFYGKKIFAKHKHTFSEFVQKYKNMLDIQPINYAIDKNFSDIIYIPENAEIDLWHEKVAWEFNQTNYSIRLLPGKHYMHPSGFSVSMHKHPTAPTWRLVLTSPVGAMCHKPCTVSGGGKSEISKALDNSIIYNTMHINDFNKDIELAEKIINTDFKKRWKTDPHRTKSSRSILSEERSLGSVIKLLTPSPLFTDEHNEFVKTIPPHVKALIFMIKLTYRKEWGNNWKEKFSVDWVNGRQGHQLQYNNRKIIASYLRVGFNSDTSWKIHKLRTDFYPAAKIQLEDDISVSTVIANESEGFITANPKHKSVKIVKNCEYRLFQRPDDAIHRGFDKQAEYDLSGKNMFICNYQPLSPDDAIEIKERAISYNLYTAPIQKVIDEGAKGKGYFISSSHPRVLDDGSKSKNVRYLQNRPDFTNPIDYYLADLRTKMHYKLDANTPILRAVNHVLPGRRNNRPEPNIKGLSVYSPIHYQELPELFMDFISSLTGKSPSTTGAGSEGALTKAPFNAITPIADLNSALLSYILTGYQGFSTAAGWVGTESRFDHDVSVLIPELWCRINENKFDAKMLVVIGALEKVNNFEFEGKTIEASRLGYRITEIFLQRYFGKIFDEPSKIFEDNVLRPEKQDLTAFAEGVENIIEAQKTAALRYFNDKSIEYAIPPLKALLHIMAFGSFEGKGIEDIEIRNMFLRKNVVSSKWYFSRLKAKQQFDIELISKKIKAINIAKQKATEQKLAIDDKFKNAMQKLSYYSSEEYLKSLNGSIGLEPKFG